MALPPPQDQQRTRQATSPTGIAPVMEFFARHAPFDRMSADALHFLARHVRLAFFPRDEVLLTPQDGTARYLYIIKQGSVVGRPQDAEDSEERFVLHSGECFPIGALAAARPVHTVYRAAGDTFCFELERSYFDELRQLSAPFADFCARRLAYLLERSVRARQAQLARRVADHDAFGTPISRLIRRPPVHCTADTPLAEVVARMHEHNVGSMVVVDAELQPLGMFTLYDLLSELRHGEHNLQTAVSSVMSPAPVCLPHDALAYEAANLFAQHGFRHLCIQQSNRLIGVISERDLFSLQRVGVGALSRALASAPNLAGLRAVSGDVHRLIDQLGAQGVGVEQIMRVITSLNDHTTRRVIELCRAEFDAPDFTWLAFGSEGRQEQTLRTDQDNGMLFDPRSASATARQRERLLPLADRINRALADCGFPLCAGDVMARNPAYCLSAEEWRTHFAAWIERSDPKDLLSVTIFFDLRVLYGDPAPAERLHHDMLKQAAANLRFQRMLAENAVATRPPLGWWRDFAVSKSGEHPHTIDLKLQGLLPFIQGARLLAVAHGIEATPTLERLRALAAHGLVPGPEADAWCSAYEFLQGLRIRQHRLQTEKQVALHNHLDPDTLTELDRRILKEAFRQARKLQRRIGLDYQL